MKEFAQKIIDAAGSQDIALTLGSGWKDAAGLLGEKLCEFPAADLGFASSGIAGHAGTIASYQLPSGHRVLVLAARTHLYQGHGVAAVVHGVRLAQATGAKICILTNGCGSTRTEFGPGTVALIADHLNFTGSTPLVGAKFIDMTDLYSPRLRAAAQRVADLPEGVYAQFHGPQYETPAEVRMAAILGADFVGMSTAVEAIAAREAGMEVLGLSLVTNHAAGTAPGELNHADVIAAGEAASARTAPLLAGIIQEILA